MQPEEMTTSENGFYLIKRHEGFRSKPYLDPAGYPTIGWGHLITDKESFSGVFDYGITEEQGEDLLKKDVKIAEQGVKNLISVPLEQHEFDALVSFVFNLGQTQLQGKTIIRMINNNIHKTDPDSVFKEFNKWVYASGIVLPGLEKRRLEEAELFRRGKIIKSIS